MNRTCLVLLFGVIFILQLVSFVSAQEWIPGLDEGLQLYYNLDESGGNLIDSLGNHAAQVEGNPVYRREGIIDGSVYATDALFTTGYVPPSGTGSKSMSFWGNVTTSEMTWAITSGSTSSVGQGFGIIFNYGGAGQIYVHGQGADFGCSGYATNIFHHIVLTYDGNIRHLYVDGVNCASSSASINTGTDQLVLFGYAPSRFNGAIDEFGFWNRSLSVDEVAQLYNEGQGLSFSSDSDGDGYFNFEDCNDDDAEIHPGAVEMCDFVDTNCDGQNDDALMCREFTCDDEIDNDLDGFIDMVDQDCSGLECRVPILGFATPESSELPEPEIIIGP